MTKSLLIARTQITVPDVGAAIVALCDYYALYDCEVIRHDDVAVIRLSAGQGELRAENGMLSVTVSSRTDTDLAYMKAGLIAILGELVPTADLAVTWRGDGTTGGKLPNFRELRVSSITDLSASMRRIRFTGVDIGCYDGGAIHVRLLLLPPGSTAPRWPYLAENGAPVWPDGPDAAIPRVYTIRRMDAQAGWLDVDFVLHGDNGPGSIFAMRAAPGDPVGMTGPLGTALPDAEWYLLAGDETALPAIGRFLEELPETARGMAVIAVDGPDDMIELATKSAIDINWVQRSQAAGDSDVLFEAVRDITLPLDRHRVFCWAGVEQATFRALRGLWREDIGLDRDQCLASTFWRHTGRDAA
ncbi:siderophore-interacting protein [Thalassospira sp.]|uniref:siderophore-interacting protein n=1 Tax=Thalassospira sp. TaxID=1912094 RepID=UPI0027342A25|nr:siderophore-interacting protein [Thalassospira sp.]MDP2697264.1 siderophore-interacting protein [Thalassospira sp.]